MTARNSHSPQWSRPLRLIHLLLAISVTAQLIIGATMRGPWPGRPESLGFEVHVVLGFSILALILLHWAWSIAHPEEGIGHLLPWTRAGLRSIVEEVRRSYHERQLPPGGPGGGVAGLVHGLGLLAITGLAMTGGLFYLLHVGGAGRGEVKPVLLMHGTLAVIAWIYWGGHLIITVLHSLLRHPTFAQMFRLSD